MRASNLDNSGALLLITFYRFAPYKHCFFKIHNQYVFVTSPKGVARDSKAHVVGGGELCIPRPEGKPLVIIHDYPMHWSMRACYENEALPYTLTTYLVSQFNLLSMLYCVAE